MQRSKAGVTGAVGAACGTDKMETENGNRKEITCKTGK